MNISRSARILILALGLSTAQAASTDASFPGSVPVLLGNDAVRKDLSLTRSQRAALDGLRSQYKADARSVTARHPQSAVERAAANATLEKLNAEYNARALAVLTPPQAQRLDQIAHQTLGGWMLFVPRIQDSLKLSAEQKALVKKIQSEGKATLDEVNKEFEEGKVSLQERLDQLRAWRIKESKKLMRLLTPVQRRSLETLRGPAFASA